MLLLILKMLSKIICLYVCLTLQIYDELNVTMNALKMLRGIICLYTIIHIALHVELNVVINVL